MYAFYSLLSFVECIPISVLVKAEYRENTFKSHSKHQESTQDYEAFLNEYNEIKRKYGAEMSVEAPALFSLSGGGSSLFNEVLDVTSHNITKLTQKSTKETTFIDGFSQIIEVITKEVRIGQKISLWKKITNFRDSVPTDHQETESQLSLRAKEYIYNNYAHEKGNIREPGGGKCTGEGGMCQYEEEGCISKKKRMYILPAFSSIYFQYTKKYYGKRHNINILL